MKIVVIGGGILGASTAYHLSKNNIQTIVMDAFQEGNATDAGAGIVCPWILNRGNENYYELAKRGARYYPELIKNLIMDGEDHTGYKKVGAIAVSEDAAELNDILEMLEMRQIDAPEMGEVQRVTSEKAREFFPLLNKELEGVYVPGGARVDGRLLRDALKRAAKKHGAEFMKEKAELLMENGKVAGVRIDGEIIYADAVIAASGAWAPSLLEPLGLKLVIEPQKGQIVHIKLPERETAEWPVIMPQNGHYLLAFDDSRVVAGATRETGSGFDYRITAGGMAKVLNEALRVAPGLEDGTVSEVRVGFRPFGPDASPLLGFVAPYKNLILANGLGSSGLTVGPYLGKLAASLAVQGEVEMDISPYDPMRAIQPNEEVLK